MFMGSPHVESLLPNAPLEETFRICNNLVTMENAFLSLNEVK